MITRCSILLLTGLAIFGGCAAENLPPTVGQLPSTRPIMPGDGRSGNGPNDTYLLVVRLELASIEVPAGMASGSEEIWSYLDEEAVREVRSPSLGFNGLRIGRGQPASWPDLARVLRAMTGRKLKETTIVAIPGRPVPIVLKSAQPAQTIFLFKADQTLWGRDYPPGDNLLTIVCTLDEEDPSKVQITGLPQVRTRYRKPRFVRRGGFMMVSRPDILSLPQLTFHVTVPQESFLVIGPGAQSARPSSVGHRFLVKEKDGVEFETVLIIKPQAFATPANTVTR